MLLQASEAIIALLLLSSVSDDQKATSTLITHTIVVRVMYNHWLDVAGIKWGWVRCVRVRVSGHCYILGSNEWRSRWEHSPPTNVAQVQIRASKPYVGWVCCWFSPLLREVFLRVLRFSPLLKNQHFQIPIQPGIRYTKNHYVDVLPQNCSSNVRRIFQHSFRI